MAMILFDTNILIDHTLGIWQATEELARYDDAAISAISWMETTCKLSQLHVAIFDADLGKAGIKIMQTTPAIMRRAAALRGQTRRKLPDCIIRATAELEGRTVVTRNAIDFGSCSNTKVRVPYKLHSASVTPLHSPLNTPLNTPLPTPKR
jgi:predicted nucleic acid-binding protein